MKKLLVAAAIALFASSAYANLTATKHNLAGATGNQSCDYCHMVHNANSSAAAGAPIWARSITPVAINPYVFSTPTPPTVNLGATQFSMLCMSCHNGSTGLGVLWNQTITVGSGITNPIGATQLSNLGTTLANDHPVGFIYPATGTPATDSGLVAATTATARGFQLFGGGYMECGTCHDPHVSSTTATDPTFKFKRAFTGATDFCAACHGLK